MILFELAGTEKNPVYQQLELSNGMRQYDFLRDLIVAAIAIDRPMLSHQVIKALNYHAITCLHTNPGEYRPCEVVVGTYTPPPVHQVQALMDDFVDQVNRYWDRHDPVYLTSWILWRLNFIHPFINGNGRTARAISYFVLCLRLGGPLPGEKILPELIKDNRDEYVSALQSADNSAKAGTLDLQPLTALLSRLLEEQIAPVTQEQKDA